MQSPAEEAFSHLVTLVAPCRRTAKAALADDKENKTVTPADAAKLVDKKVTFEMEVKSTGKSSGVFFLNSEEDFKSEKNYTIFISKEGTTKFKETKVDEPAAQLNGKTVRVIGTVKLYRYGCCGHYSARSSSAQSSLSGGLGEVQDSPSAAGSGFVSPLRGLYQCAL
jgi:hypothetical protein